MNMNQIDIYDVFESIIVFPMALQMPGSSSSRDTGNPDRHGSQKSKYSPKYLNAKQICTFDSR